MSTVYPQTSEGQVNILAMNLTLATRFRGHLEEWLITCIGIYMWLIVLPFAMSVTFAKSCIWISGSWFEKEELAIVLHLNHSKVPGDIVSAQKIFPLAVIGILSHQHGAGIP